MREIKFRGKVEGKWWYVRVSDDHISGSWAQFWALVDRKMVGQYIDCHDKNGNPIFEGDIVATGFTEEHVKSVVRIGKAETSVDVYDNTLTRPYYGVYLEGSYDLEEYLLRGEMYVVGNVYES